MDQNLNLLPQSFEVVIVLEVKTGMVETWVLLSFFRHIFIKAIEQKMRLGMRGIKTISIFIKRVKSTFHLACAGLNTVIAITNV